MSESLKRGDRVEWSFRGRRVAGRIQRKLTARSMVGDVVVAASKEDPRYVVKTEKSGKLTARRPSVLTKLNE